MNEQENLLEAIEHFESMLRDHRKMKDGRLKEHLVRTHETAISALRAQQEQAEPKPLTYDEITRMNGKPIFLTGKHVHGFWTIVSVGYEGEFAYFVGVNMDLFYKVNYGKTWIAYATEPKEDCHTFWGRTERRAP